MLTSDAIYNHKYNSTSCASHNCKSGPNLGIRDNLAEGQAAIEWVTICVDQKTRGRRSRTLYFCEVEYCEVVLTQI